MTTQPKNHIEYGLKQKTLSSYLTGFVLSSLLTITAFLVVAGRPFSDTYLYISLAVLAAIQLMVQSTCFLSLNSSEEGKWNLLPFLFTIVIIAILAGGSLWIMYNLDYNMAH